MPREQRPKEVQDLELMHKNSNIEQDLKNTSYFPDQLQAFIMDRDIHGYNLVKSLVYLTLSKYFNGE